MTPHRLAHAAILAAACAQYKVNDRATVDVQQGSYGNSARWGSATNAGGVRANLKVGF